MAIQSENAHSIDSVPGDAKWDTQWCDVFLSGYYRELQQKYAPQIHEAGMSDFLKANWAEYGIYTEKRGIWHSMVRGFIPSPYLS